MFLDIISREEKGKREKIIENGKSPSFLSIFLIVLFVYIVSNFTSNSNAQ
jgi:hypothetical protein|tara:strand:- start:331 stop:480 length:150 start_codon:yes stop_codon:yes gene_type:complete